MSKGEIFQLIEMIDRQSLEDFDPFFHYTMLEAMSDKVTSPTLVTTEDGEVLEDHRVSKAIQSSELKLSENLTYLSRAFRYFVSETLVLFLLSGYPFGPFARAASTIKAEKLNSIFRDLSSRKVPENYSLSQNGKQFSFDQWISHRISGDPDWLFEVGHAGLVELVVEEARMLCERGAINAFKHGKPFDIGKSPQLKFTNKETGASAEVVQLEGINWIEWAEKSGSLSFGFFTEEVIPKQDKSRILNVSILNNSIRDFRLARINGSEVAAVNFPSNFALGMSVRRQKLKVNFNKDGKVSQCK